MSLLPHLAAPQSRPLNVILASLPDAEYERLAPQLRSLQLKLGDVLHNPGEFVERVYFVNKGMFSCVLTSGDGAEVEVGVIGCEGAACALPALADAKNFTRIVVQTRGDAVFLTAEQMCDAFECGGEFQKRVLQHIQFFTEQTGQVALCNRLHSVEERLARWLLMTQDRTQNNHLELTQEFLANMLGRRRAGVTLAAGVLKKAGLVDYTRGKITILDREGLESVACECYDVLRGQFQRVMQ